MPMTEVVKRPRPNDGPSGAVPTKGIGDRRRLGAGELGRITPWTTETTFRGAVAGSLGRPFETRGTPVHRRCPSVCRGTGREAQPGPVRTGGPTEAPEPKVPNRWDRTEEGRYGGGGGLVAPAMGGGVHRYAPVGTLPGPSPRPARFPRSPRGPTRNSGPGPHHPRVASAVAQEPVSSRTVAMSLNGIRVSPTVWWGSLPLPAIRMMSSGPAAERAKAIAACRSAMRS